MSEILYALDENDKIVKIDDVSNGKNCGCRCPLCGEPLVAKNGGKIKIHHFAHEVECKYKEHLPQSQIHIMAKQIIEREKKICVPHEFGFREISITDVKLEKIIGEIIPDIIATASGSPFIIEIYVTHKVDDAKKEKIRALNIPAVEIDLHDLPYTLTEDSLKTELYNPHRVDWIFYPAIKSSDNIITRQKEFIKNFGIKSYLLDEYLKCSYFAKIIPVNNSGKIQITDIHIISISFCKTCPFCYYEKQNNFVYCGRFRANEINPQIIVNENKIMTNEETENYYRYFENKLRQNITMTSAQITNRMRSVSSGPRIEYYENKISNSSRKSRSSYNGYKRKKRR